MLFVVIVIIALGKSIRATHVCNEAAFNKDVSVSCPKGMLINEILYAAFSTKIVGSCSTGVPFSGGALDLNWNCDTAVNVMGMVQGRCLYDNSCSFSASRSSFSFQAPESGCANIIPRLAINVSCALPSAALPAPLPTFIPICGSARDGTSMKLSCASAPFALNGGDYVISRVDFASYGRPLGQCNASLQDPFHPYTCDSINSEAIVQATCLNQAQCTVPIAPSTFSSVSTAGQDMAGYCASQDPQKWLFVRAVCSKRQSENQAFFYSAMRNSGITTGSVVSCPIENTFISKIDMFAFGEPSGSFLQPSRNGNLSGLLQIAASSKATAVFLSLFRTRNDQCDCISPSSTSQTCPASNVLSLINNRCLLKPNCTVPIAGSFFGTSPTAGCMNNNGVYSFNRPMLYLQGECFGCPRGSIYADLNEKDNRLESTACKLCMGGTYAPSIGSRRCLVPPIGTQATYEMGDGKFALVGATGYSTCPGGMHRPSLDLSLSTKSFQCIPCSSGAISQPYPYPTECVPCSPGTAPTDVKLNCVDCLIGNYAELGDNECRATPAGSFPSTAMGSNVFASSKAGGYSLCAPGSFSAGTTGGQGGWVCSLCGLGAYAPSLGMSSCLMAPPGSFVDSVGSANFQLCSPMTFSNAGATTCTPCPYPLTSSASGSDSCPNVSLSVSISSLASTLSAMLVVFSLCVFSSGPGMAVKILANTIFPALDVFSDLSYLLTVKFYNYALFGLSFCAYSYGVPYFVGYLITHNIRPQVWIWSLESALWLGYSRSNDPIFFATVHHRRILNLDSHSNIILVLVEVVIWVAAISLQLLCLLLWPVVALLYFTFLASWFVLGIYLHMSKVLSIGRVWNGWVFIWRGFVADEFQTDISFDTEEHNVSLRNEFFFETMPQFLLQITNNTLTKTWSDVAIFSATLSIFMAVNGIYRISYYTVMLSPPIPLYKVPAGNVLRLQLSFPIAIDFTLDSRLANVKKTFSARHLSTATAAPPTSSPLQTSMLDIGVKKLFYRFFAKYVPIDIDVIPSCEDGEDSNLRSFVDELLSSEQYIGQEEEVFADVCLDMCGTHPRDWRQSPSRASAVESTDEGSLKHGEGRSRNVSNFEMTNPSRFSTTKRL